MFEICHECYLKIIGVNILNNIIKKVTKELSGDMKLTIAEKNKGSTIRIKLKNPETKIF
jgi:hypothetical protein